MNREKRFQKYFSPGL